MNKFDVLPLNKLLDISKELKGNYEELYLLVFIYTCTKPYINEFKRTRSIIISESWN